MPRKGIIMPDYAKMYYRLFNAQTDAISLLQKAQQDTEEMHISAPDSEIHLLTPPQTKDD
ncbi:MAG: hypothetical protein FWE32_01610 [Oscillospiraceae bacterium]|nr:hypothetical protein [Oscillospiraceae bacterium]